MSLREGVLSDQGEESTIKKWPSYQGASDDAKEGVMSFLEKRRADFKNTLSSDLPDDFPWRKSQFKGDN